MRHSIFAFSLACILGAMGIIPAQASDRELLSAALRNDAAQVSALLASGANPNTRGAKGETPLMVAAVMGNQDMAEALLAAGARTDPVDELNRTALWIAAYRANAPLVQLLLEEEESQAIINLQEKESLWTPLHAGVMFYLEADALRALVRNGADTQLKELLGATPVDFCRESQLSRSRCRSAGLL